MVNGESRQDSRKTHPDSASPQTKLNRMARRAARNATPSITVRLPAPATDAAHDSLIDNINKGRNRADFVSQ
jgi:hypothetical protein